MAQPDTDAPSREAAAWTAFVHDLADHLVAQWPAMQDRLGERYRSFVELAAQQALKQGLSQAASVARFANLCFVWGPSFHDKPGFEWAQGLLAGPRVREWAQVHQLVQRSLRELQRLPEARIEPAALAAADQRLVETFGHLGRHGALHPPEPPVLPLHACDLEAMELRVLELAVSEQYVFEAGAWQRRTLPVPAPVRVDAAKPVPGRVAVLAHPPGVAPRTVLQLRSRSLTVCDADVHPALTFGGTHGLWRWAGHETRAVSWPVSTLLQAGPAAGPGSAVAEETSPDIFALDLQVCSLRDDGDALGTQSTQVWAWPAEQWFLELERKAPAAQPVLADRELALPVGTRVRVESDGEVRDSSLLKRGFEQGLDRASAAALQRLLKTLSAIDGLAAPRLEGVLALLVGRAALTWGWCLGPSGLDGRAFLRLLGTLAMQACQADLQAESELALQGGRARLVLRCAGSPPLDLPLRREAADPPLLSTLLPARLSFTLPWTAEVTPIAIDTGTLLQAAGPCTGAIAGEAGLRPRSSGGSGWEWFATLRLVEGGLPLALVDPVLGVQRFSHTLWADTPLLDWSLG
jgi:hypothetical protein